AAARAAAPGTAATAASSATAAASRVRLRDRLIGTPFLEARRVSRPASRPHPEPLPHNATGLSRAGGARRRRSWRDRDQRGGAAGTAGPLDPRGARRPGG